MTQQSPTEDLIRYDVMVQEALLGVVRKVLTDAARQGLPGEHHFYVTFRSEAPGVRLSARLREKYPEEMTIVLQHQFWDLAVGENGFEVGLSFGGVPERLYVPFDAMTGFYDPSVQFGLKFTPDETVAEAEPAGEEPEPSVKEQLAAITKLEKTGKSKRGAASEPKLEPPAQDAPAPRRRTAADKATADKTTADRPAKEPAREGPGVEPANAETAKSDAPQKDGGAEVVSLEAFRKKK